MATSVTTSPTTAHSSIAERPARRSLALLGAALLIAALACLAPGVAPRRRASAARCASHAAHSSVAARRVRAASPRAHARASVATGSVVKHKRASHGVTVQAPAISASCRRLRRRQQPTLGSEGFSCADGSEPTCANGAEPVPAEKGSTAVCPTTPGATVEWSEAEMQRRQHADVPLGGGYRLRRRLAARLRRRLAAGQHRRFNAVVHRLRPAGSAPSLRASEEGRRRLGQLARRASGS